MATRIKRPKFLSGLFGELTAEFLGTLVLILFGEGVNATFSLFGSFANE